MREWFYLSDPAGPHRFDDQLTLGLTLFFALQGFPCLYYGTEQGLHEHGGRDLAKLSGERPTPSMKLVNRD